MLPFTLLRLRAAVQILVGIIDSRVRVVWLLLNRLMSIFRDTQVIFADNDPLFLKVLVSTRCHVSVRVPSATSWEDVAIITYHTFPTKSRPLLFTAADILILEGFYDY